MRTIRTALMLTAAGFGLAGCVVYPNGAVAPLPPGPVYGAPYVAPYVAPPVYVRPPAPYWGPRPYYQPYGGGYYRPYYRPY